MSGGNWWRANEIVVIRHVTVKKNRSAAMAALIDQGLLRCCKSGACALPNQSALELRKRAEHVKHQDALRASSVE
jgi:hypothetical protein